MVNRYYFTIRSLVDHTDCSLMASRCISELHCFMADNRNTANAIGISFPKWNDNNIGEAVAFVGDRQEVLAGLRYQPYFSLMCTEGIFEVSPVQQVPRDVSEVKFVRNQTIDKSFLDSKRRRLRRAEKRAAKAGREFTPVAEEERVFLPFHSIPMGSTSSGEDFVLQVQMNVNVVQEERGFNMYGLATNMKWQGTVPMISI